MKIRDEFSGLPITPQARLILRRRRDGRCTVCGHKRHPDSLWFCGHHFAQKREYMRRKNGCEIRHAECPSYQEAQCQTP